MRGNTESPSTPLSAVSYGTRIRLRTSPMPSTPAHQALDEPRETNAVDKKEKYGCLVHSQLSFCHLGEPLFLIEIFQNC